MAKFVYVYYSGSDDAGNDQAWGEWFQKLGGRLIDAGNPFNDGGKAVHKGGVMDVQDKPVTG